MKVEGLLGYLWVSHFIIDRLKDKSPSPIVKYFSPGLYIYYGGPVHSLRDIAPRRLGFFYSYIFSYGYFC